ncbi:MAG: type II secretion system F family protein, partial [Methanobacteriota archaeon]
MALTEFQRTCYKMLGGFVSKRMDLDELQEQLRKSHEGVRAEAYLAYILVITAIVGVGGLVMSLFLLFVLFPVTGISVPPVLIAILASFPVLVSAITYAVFLSIPQTKMKSRAKKIDAKLPYALNYVAAMASAGVNVDVIFKSLAEQPIYGEAAREAAWIYRDIHLFGKDTVTALKRAIERSPSPKFQEFLQGAITTVTSGGDLQAYFIQKAQRYMFDNKLEQKAFVDTMGLMAETYVTAAVAGPLFLIVMMAIMGMLGGGGASQLYLVVYLLLPVANAGFVYGLMAMTP